MLRDDRAGGEGRRQAARNVLGEVLEICSITPMTGFYRDGCCNTGRDRWCLCAPRWQEAFEANQAPRVILRATHEGALAHCSLGDLKRFAVDLA